MSQYRAAIIGCGKIASGLSPVTEGDLYSHAASYIESSRTQLVAVCDSDHHAAQLCAQKWQVEHYYDSASKMLQSHSIDIVSVCTPDAVRLELVKELVTYPIKAILLEKPIALDIEQAKQIITLCEEHDIRLAVNYSRRFSKLHKQLKSLIQRNQIGGIQNICGLYTKGIIHNGTHWLDLARMLLGEINSVQPFNHIFEETNDPTLSVQMTFSDGVIGVLYGCDADSYAVFEMDIVGTSGRIKILESGNHIELYQVEDSDIYAGYQHLKLVKQYPGDINQSILFAIENLVGHLEGHESLLCTGRDALRVLEIASDTIAKASGNYQVADCA